jgi:tetratricopeptide (TPR) repeat protein
MNIRLFAPLLVLLAACLPAQPAWAAIGAAEAMNLSGMQRMLSQRIAKSYLMLASQVRPEQAGQQLEQSIAKFESNYLALREYAPTAEIRGALEQTGQTWQQYRELVLNRPEPTTALRVLELSDRLLAQSERVVQLLERHSGGQSAVLVNRSGRQRMLSQRIAKLYLAMSWRLPITDLRAQFDQAVDEFEQALGELQQARQNTAAIAKGLQAADAQWRFTRAGFDLASDSRYVPTVIAVTTETLLWQMHELTNQYEGVMLAGN